MGSNGDGERRSSADLRILRSEIQAAEHEGVITIFAARSRDLDAPNTISVWHREIKQQVSLGPMFCGILVFLQMCFVVVGALLYYFEFMVL